MKKIYILLFILILMVSFIACGDKKVETVESALSLLFNVSYDTNAEELLDKLMPYIEADYFENDFRKNRQYYTLINRLKLIEGKLSVNDISLDFRENNVVYFTVKSTLKVSDKTYDLTQNGIMNLASSEKEEWKITFYQLDGDMFKEYETLKSNENK